MDEQVSKNKEETTRLESMFKKMMEKTGSSKLSESITQTDSICEDQPNKLNILDINITNKGNLKETDTKQKENEFLLDQITILKNENELVKSK